MYNMLVNYMLSGFQKWLLIWAGFGQCEICDVDTLLKHLLEDFAQVCEYLGANIEGNDFGSCLCRIFLSICLSVSKPFQ